MELSGTSVEPPVASRPAVPRAVPALIGLMLAAALLIDVAALHIHLAPTLSSEHWLRFGLAVVAFALADGVVVHFELGRNAHSISLGELALAVALFFLPAGAIPVARLLGGAPILLLIRRQPAVKAAFNAAVWLLDIAVATATFQALGGALDAGAEHLVLPAIVAAVTAAAVDSVAVNTVIAVTSHEIRLAATLRLLGICVAGAFGCGTLAVVCVGALAWNPWLLLPSVLVVGGIVLGFRAIGVTRRQHRNVKVLYNFADRLARAAHGDALLHAVLDGVVSLMRAERASLWLERSDRRLEAIALDRDGRTVRSLVTLAEAPDLLGQSLFADAPVLAVPGTTREADAELLRWYDARDAVLAPVRTNQGLRGVLVVADRLGDVSSFTADDAALLHALATHAGTALANSRLVEQLNYDSTHDSLTGLANRAHFQQRLSAALHAPATTAVLLMDLDRFKEVNDTLGHHHGDLLLQQIATRLAAEIRPTDVLARLGGDEFAVLVAGMNESEVIATARRMRDALALPMTLEGVQVEVNASIGVAVSVGSPHLPAAFVGARPRHDAAPHSGRTAAAMLQQADVAMYVAKSNGTGVHAYQECEDEYSPRRLELAGSLRSALEAGQLSLRYQPQARVADGTLLGAEALVRWEHPTFGEIGPDEFIGIAEQTGQIRELTRYVLDRALADAARWAAAGHELRVSVNISVRNLMEPDLVNAIMRLLVRHGVPSRLLTLEITESHLMADAARTRQVLHEIADLGVCLSIDDFGTGYSSLAYLKRLPVGEVKIDKSFIRQVAVDTSDAAIVEAIVHLAKTLRLEVVAEGVEDQASEDRLRAIGCVGMQGYHLARPMAAEPFLAFLTGYRRAGRPNRRALRALPGQRTGAPQVPSATA